MARIKIKLPESFHFKTEIEIRITEINYGGHLGNDSLLGILHEARVRFFQSLGVSEINFFNSGIIMADVAIEYKAEGFYADVLEVEIAVADISHSSFDLVYRVSKKGNGKNIALAKTGMVTFDYEKRKVVPIAEVFKQQFTV